MLKEIWQQKWKLHPYWEWLKVSQNDTARLTRIDKAAQHSFERTLDQREKWQKSESCGFAGSRGTGLAQALWVSVGLLAHRQPLLSHKGCIFRMPLLSYLSLHVCARLFHVSQVFDTHTHTRARVQTDIILHQCCIEVCYGLMKYTLTSFTLSVVVVRVRRFGLIIFHYLPVKTLRANTPLYLIV